MPVNANINIRRRWVRWAIIFGFWTGIGLFFAVQMIISYTSQGDEARWGPALVYQMSRWYAWGLLTPLLLGLAHRYRLERPWRRNVLVHLAASLLVAPFQVVLGLVLRFGAFVLLGTVSLEQVAGFLPTMPLQILTGSFDSFITYWIILSLYYTFDYYQKHRERQLHASQLEAQLAQAQLKALKMQLHPHFLFNTLHGISALIPTDPEAAERMIARLSDLLRLTLENEGTQEVSLKQELDFLEHYLEIERMRFQDRLSVEIDVDPAALDARVPNLILQPLVENAIRHGVAPRPEAGSVRIHAALKNGVLRLQVRDDGPGLTNGRTGLREGVGLANTRKRLTQLYGAAHRFEYVNAPGGGLEVNLELPFRVVGK